MTILIISHTKHYRDANGNIVGWGSTVKEIDYVANAFGNVIHIGCLYENVEVPATSLPYSSGKVRFVAIPPYGGPGLQKLTIFTKAIKILRTVRNELKKADIFQFRAPTSMGLYVIPYLTFFTKIRGWYKYAGNWGQPHPPLSYRFQKQWLLRHQYRPITINGRWPDQPSKCLSFENPCLTDSDRLAGKECLNTKSFSPPYTFCFVGRVEKEKGIFSIISALKRYPDLSVIGTLEIIGDGVGMSEVNALCNELAYSVVISGSLPREKLFDVYRRSHFIMLPSESEGFPKVIAEAANFGCIPVVSDVSCIGQYINDRNGFLWNKNGIAFDDFFQSINLQNTEDLHSKARKAFEFAGYFTYEKYITHLHDTIIDSKPASV